MNDSNVTLYATTGVWGVAVDVRIFPVICPKCHSYLPDLFIHKSSRYGYVGAETCTCGEQLHISDNDQEFVDKIKVVATKKKITIDFKEFYQLTEAYFKSLKENYNYDIYKEHLEEKLSLEDLILEVEVLNNITIKPVETNIPLPLAVRKWFGLMKIKGVKMPKE